MTLDPAHRLPDGDDGERRRSELRARDARRLWQRERGRVKRRLMLPLLFVVFVVATLPLGIVGVLGGAPLVSVAATVACLGVAVALLRLPLESPVWAMGRIGEPKAAAWLEPLLDAGFVVLLDRTVPPEIAGLATRPSQVEVDSLVVGPGGVFLIEPTRWRGPAVIRDGRLVVGDADRTAAVAEVRDKALTVAVVLDAGLPQHIPITPVVCALGGQVGSAVTPAGGRIVDGPALGPWLSGQPAMFDGETVARIAGLADRRLPYRTPGTPT